MATQIVGIQGKTLADIDREIGEGAQFVYFMYTISVLVMTFRRSTDIHFLAPGESRFARSWPHSLLTLLMGWWGIPWGPIYTVQSLFTNLNGGKIVTEEVWANLILDAQQQQARAVPLGRPAPMAEPAV